MIGGRWNRLGREFGQTAHGLRAKNGGVTGDGHLGGAFGTRCPPVQCNNEFAEPAGHIAEAHRHGTAPLGRSWRRPTFQISPHRWQRQ
jgi:hypothetical protein